MLLLEYGERRINSSRFMTHPPYWARWPKCDGDHPEPECRDPFCWHREPPSLDILAGAYAPSWFFDPMHTNPNAAAQTVGSDRISCPANIIAGEIDEAVIEIVRCLKKYQARYHGTKHAQKLWDRADRALKAFASKR